MAKAGPIPMTSGGTPMTEYATNFPKIGSFSFSATDLLAKRTPAAPSVTYDEFPAVVVPPCLKAGFNLPKLCKVVSFLIPSSYITVISVSFPS